MEHIRFVWYDYTLFLFVLTLSAAIGIYFGLFKKQNTTKDYLHGGKKMKVFPVAMSLAASTVTGVAILGVPAEIYMYGTQFWMMIISVVIMGYAINLIYLPVFYKLQATSIFEYLEMRFDKRVRSATSTAFTLSCLLAMPVIIYAPSLAFTHVTGLNLHVTASLMSLLCVFYTTIGGVKAVVWTDTLQFCVTLFTIFTVLIVGTISVGGFSTIWEKAENGSRLEFFNMDPDPTVRSSFWSVVIGNTFFWLSVTGCSQGTMQRFLAVPTYKDAQKVLLVLIIFTIITKCIGCFCGLIVYAKYYDCDPLTAGLMKRADQIIPFYVMDVARQIPGIGGLFVAALFTTALSALSTILNALAGTIYGDFVEPLMPTNTSELKASCIMKIISLIIGVLGTALIFVVERLGTILQLIVTVSGVTSGPILGLFTMGMLLPTVNSNGAVAGMVCSIIFMTITATGNQVLIWNGALWYTTKPFYTYGCGNVTISSNKQSIEPLHEDSVWLFRISFYYYVFMGATISIVVGLIVSWFTKRKDDKAVDPDLLSPCIHRFLSEKTLSAKYCTVEQEIRMESKM